MFRQPNVPANNGENNNNPPNGQQRTGYGCFGHDVALPAGAARKTDSKGNDIRDNQAENRSRNGCHGL